MALSLEDYIEKLAGELRSAADLKVWEVPMHHRTKDSVSSYRAAVGMVGAVMLKVLREMNEPPVLREPAVSSFVPEPETAVVETAVAETIEDAPSVFDEQPRQRRRREGNNAA